MAVGTCACAASTMEAGGSDGSSAGSEASLLDAPVFDAPGDETLGVGSDGVATEGEPAEEVTDDAETAPIVTESIDGYDVTGPAGLSGADAFAQMTDAVSAYEALGYDVGFVLIDLGSGSQVAYNADEAFYPASSIKGLYVTWLFEELVETGEVDEASIDSLVEDTIVLSDNDAYRTLRDRFGYDGFYAWCLEKGLTAPPDGSLDEWGYHNYPHSTANQFATLWKAVYAYLESDTEASQTLASYFEQRETSPFKTAVGDRYASWGKAGWYYEVMDDASPSTCESGVILADDHPYLLAIMSNGPGTLDELAEVVVAIDAVAAELAG